MESARRPCCTTFCRLSFKRPVRLVDLVADVACERDRRERRVQLVGQFGGERGKIVDEVERVLDLVGDAGRELAERGQLLGLDQPVLRGAQIVERFGKLPRAILHLVEQAGVLDRDHGLVGEGLEQVDRLVRELTSLRPRHRDGADRNAVAQHRHHEDAAIASRARQLLHGVCEIGLVLHVGADGIVSALGHPAVNARRRQRCREGAEQIGVAGFVVRGEGGQMQHAVLEAGDGRRMPADQRLGAVGDGLEHRGDVGRRGRDHLEDVGGRGLALQRLARRIEQADILDRDHRLVGESLQQPHVMLGEGAGGPAGRDDDADGFALAHQGREQHAAIAAGARDVARGRFELGVGQLRRGAVGHERKGREARERHRERGLQHAIAGRIGRRERGKMRRAVDIAQHCRGEAADQPVGVGGDGVEHRLHVGRRGGHHLQDVGGRGLAFQRLPDLVEQACILDRDHGLIGKGLQQLHEVGRERAWLGAGDADHADRRAAVHQRHEQHAAEAAQPRQIAVQRGDVRSLAVGKLDRLAAAHQRKGRKLRDLARERGLQPCVGLRAGRRVGHEMQLVADELEHGGGEATEQASGTRRNLSEYRTGIGGRGRDIAQDLGAGALAVARNRKLAAQSRVLGGELVGDVMGSLGHLQSGWMPRRARHRAGLSHPPREEPASGWPHVPGRDTSVSLLVMNSSNTGMPSCVFWMPRLMAGMMSSGFVTRSP